MIKSKFIDAAERNDIESMEFCFGVGDIDVNWTNDRGKTALRMACENCHISIVERLMKCEDLDVNKAGKDMKTPFFIACSKGYEKLVAILLEHPEIDVNTQDKYTNTPFMAALRIRHLGILGKLLLSPKLDINQQKKDGTTALMLAITLAAAEIVRDILRRPDIDLTLKNKKGQTARDLAEAKKLKEIISAFDARKRKISRHGSKTKFSYHQKITPGSVLRASVEDFDKLSSEAQIKSTLMQRKKTGTKKMKEVELAEPPKKPVVNVRKNETGQKIVNVDDRKASAEKSESDEVPAQNIEQKSKTAEGAVGTAEKRTEESLPPTVLLLSDNIEHAKKLQTVLKEKNVTSDVSDVASTKLKELSSSLKTCKQVILIFEDSKFFSSEISLGLLALAFKAGVDTSGFWRNEKESFDGSSFFKNLLGQGHDLVPNQIWDSLNSNGLTYPEVHDALEKLSKNMVSKEQDLLNHLMA